MFLPHFERLKMPLSMKFIPYYKKLILCVLLLVPAASWSQADVELGKTLFKNQCASCHNKNMKDRLTGPALGGVQERWADYPEEDLYGWIRNSQAMIADGHPKAVELWNEWKPTVMNAFPNLTDDEIASLLFYIDGVYTGAIGGKPAAADGVAAATDKPQPTNKWIYYGLFAILAVLAIVLARIINNLNYLTQLKEGEELPERKTLVQQLTSRGVVTFLIFALVVLGGYTTVNNAIDLGRQQGYAPEQPIKFSHATHAGLHKIDCQYCHDGARRSKHSVIPAANTCMNCHRAIKKGSKYGTGELTKIFASIGYDPINDKYVENYEAMSDEDIEKMYVKWIEDQYLLDEDMAVLDPEGELAVSRQWEHIVESLTNDTKEKVFGPIEWVRIHNLPDHVYFNHAQHVTVGQLECQQCHGKIEEMEVAAQYAPLSMGWCINCHRETEVQFSGNEYYESYQKYHEEIKNGNRSNVTVEEIGGLECQKCHY